MNYKIIDHTADIAVEFYGRTMENLFERAPTSLCQIVYQRNELEPSQKSQALDLILNDDDLAINFIDLLREVLFLINQDHYYFTESKINNFEDNAISITCNFVILHAVAIVNEFKAVTYHDCAIEERKIDGKNTYVAKVTFDI